MRRTLLLALVGLTLGLLGNNRAIAQEPVATQPVHLTFLVPEEAQVWVEGVPTTMRGPVRQFDSPALPVGQSYVYTVRVRWQRYGQTIDQKRDITVKSGDYVELNYAGPEGGYTGTPAVTFGKRNVAYYYPPSPASPGYPSADNYRPGTRSPYGDRWHGYFSYYGATPGWGTAETTGAGAGG